MAVLAVALKAQLQAQVKTEVKEFNQAGPFAVSQPLAIDTVDVNGKKYDAASVLSSVSLLLPATATCQAGLLPSLDAQQSVGVLSFYVNTISSMWTARRHRQS